MKVYSSPLPAKVVQIADTPRAGSGRIVELAIPDAVDDRPVKNKEERANPEAFDLFSELVEMSALLR